VRHPLVALVFGVALALPGALVAQPAAPASAEPDTLPARWARPFAVEARGEAPQRSPRTSVVRAQPEAAAAAPSPLASAPAAPASSAPGAPKSEAPSRPAPAAPPAARPERPTSTAPEKSAARTHLVAPGETFLALARRYGVSYSALLAANPGLDPDRIRPGQTLRLPAGPRTHVVTRGETLFGIARRYDIEPERIRAANRLTDDKVKIGQTLVIPAK
jgi:LysM repeat protein